MLNNSQNNSADNKNNMNTKGLVFKNALGFEPSVIEFNCWNDLLSIKIHPELPKDKQTDDRKFDYDKAITTALTVQKSTLLAERIKNEIFPAIKEGTDKNIGVPVGGNSLISIGTGVKKFGKVRPYIAIFKSLDETTKKPEVAIFYEFRQENSVDDYDETTGTFQLSVDIPIELMVFFKILENSVIGFSNIIAHSIRYVDKYYKDQSLDLLKQIAAVNGVSTGKSGKSGFNNFSSNVFGNASTKNENYISEPVNTERLTNLEDIDKFLS